MKIYYRMLIWLSKILTGCEFGSEKFLPDKNLAFKYHYQTSYPAEHFRLSLVFLIYMGSHDLLHGIHVYFKELGLSVATFLRWPKKLSFMIFGLPQVHKPLGWYSSWALRKSGQILQAITQAIKICYDNPYPAGSGREIPSCTLVVNMPARDKPCAFTFTTLVHVC